MKSKRMRTIAITTALVSALGGSAMSAQDKYTVKVPGGLAFSEFRGYEGWHAVSVSQDGPLIAAILANPVMIDAYRAGVPGNGKPFPDGSKMAKIHWTPKKMEAFPAATVPGTQHDVDFMVKDSKRFLDAASYSNAPQPHPPLSLNLLLSFTMKSTSCSVPGTVAAGNVSSFFGFQWIFAILEPSGKGLPFPGTPAR